jgi:hypothetical protein
VSLVVNIGIVKDCVLTKRCDEIYDQTGIFNKYIETIIGKIILKCVSKKQGGRVWALFIWLRIGTTSERLWTKY